MMMTHNVGSVQKTILSKRGSVLVYIVVLMLIFGFLGATMVSLFSTSVTSSATPNENRRALYISESGIRYAMSELQNNDFSKATTTRLNNLTYNMDQAGSFKLNIFSPWFESVGIYDSATDGQTISVRVPEGVLPPGYLASLPANITGFFLVNYNYIDTTKPPRPQSTAFSPITAITGSTPTSLTITLANDFVAGHNEKVAMAVSPLAGNQNIPSQGHIDLDTVAKNVFPLRGGAFEVQKRNFYYTSRDDSDSGRTRLLGILPVEKEKTLPDIIVDSNDIIILSPRNRLILSEGNFGNVTFGNQPEYAYPIANTSVVLSEQSKPDIEFEEESDLRNSLNIRSTTASGQSFIRVPLLSTAISIEGLSGFGATWFKENRVVGSERTFCANFGECLFNNGIRVFFILDYLGEDGDGFTFSIINGPNNSQSSVGGDVDLSQLLAYAGDSRRRSNPTLTSHFLDNRGVGLVKPKMAVEFDGFTNNGGTDICLDSTHLNPNSRNDHTPDIDRVQFVFWGDNDNISSAVCRENPSPLPNATKTYDDNQHGAPNSEIPNTQDSLTNARLNLPLLPKDWLQAGKWGVRIEIERNEIDSSSSDFIIRTWMINCTDILTCAENQPFYRNTRYKYDWAQTPAIPVMEQSFTLLGQNHIDFNTFLFGFTSATSAFQSISINKFQLSFIRSNDPLARD
jgi:hypothetical protein